MDAFASAKKTLIFRLLVPLCAAAAVWPVDAQACDSADIRPCHGRLRPVFDGSTLCAWHRTWHGPNALDTPLNGYYIPRIPGGCECDVWADGCGDQVAELDITLCPTDCDCPHAGDCCPAGMGLEPAGMERLGQIPNDLALSAEGAGASPKGAARPGR